ncbi:single-stranded-DNA-specific exonuclease RecJ [Lysinibacillus sp. SGAir0095]|uniref:single-stranded-DNA-specific exonuclease RecJ n=1 Tax=Lysinibacillus sp. SGAir0095 TaxID=2070463 RepID=UPI0010CD3C54|nr:single-stranded-DNA-specific exonuclease RecJ [Lysinibacillus sp. SGAir0095]QCR33004.1 single-stranded-DNA-specific exonuclease RecJ [Lysinibacillus sp. SGAir0095]
MIQSTKKWVVEQPNEDAIKQLQSELNISTLAAKILIARGYSSAEKAKRIIKMDESNLHDPYLLSGMTEAVERIEKALNNGEKILIYGDYDADGITSTTVMMNVLLDLGADVNFCTPNRFTHGYGPHEELFRKAHKDGVQLIITVDNGISGIEPIRVAKDLGMDVIVTDHHEAGDVLPPADVIIHPRVPEGHYPFGELAGVGVAFKLAHALYGEVPEHLYEFAAIGTVADLVPLEGENRYIVQQGIKQLKTSNNPWVRALCEITSVKQHEIDEDAIGFYFAPRLNAIGRLGDAGPGVAFLMSESDLDAANGAKRLNQKNVERKEIVNTITEQAIEMIENDPTISNSLVLVIAKEGWNPGVIGIVASRLVEKYYRPAIVLSLDPEKGTAKGSGRSIEGFHLYQELAKNRELLPHFGGHPMAAGMTFGMEHVDEIRSRLHHQALECLTDEMLTPKLSIDVPVDVSEVTVEAIEEIKQLGPFGTGFAKPVYALQNVQVRSMRKIGAGENHLKLELEDSHGFIDAIGFGKGNLYDEITYGVKLSFVGDLQINEWQGKKKPQLMITDVQTNEWQLYDYRGKNQVHKWIHTLPKEESDFIAFRHSTVQAFDGQFTNPIRLITKEDEMKNLSPNLVLLDLPKSAQTLEKLIQQERPNRIYAVFYTPESKYFNGMPTREHFGWYYSFLKKRPNFNLQLHLEKLAQHIGLNVEVIKFMTNVFFELGFVTIENGLTTVNSNVPKRLLSEAKVYKQRIEEIDLEQQLLYAPYLELKQWFNERMREFNYS